MPNVLKMVTLLLTMLVSACATQTQKGNVDAQKLSKAGMPIFAVYAMMASNSYLDTKRTYFPIENLGWIRVDLDGNSTDENSYTPSWIGKIFSNLQYDIWEHSKTNKTVISFKGTDEVIDWVTGNIPLGISIQYKSAKKHVKRYIEDNPGREVVVTGHSLGGGLALSSSLWLGVDAYVFNPSPRVFDGLGDNRKPAVRKVVYQDNEILSKLRSFSPKFKDVVNEKDIYQTSFNYNEESNHRADLHAEGILRCSTNDLQLLTLANALKPVKVSCNL